MTVSYDFLGFIAKALGLALVFIGALVIVITVTPPSCLASTPPCTSYVNTALNGLLAGRILLVLGFAGLATGAGIRLRYTHAWPESTTTTDAEARRMWGLRLGNGVLLIASLFFTVWILVGVTAIPGFP